MTQRTSRLDPFRRSPGLLWQALMALPAAALTVTIFWALYVFTWAAGGG